MIYKLTIAVQLPYRSRIGNTTVPFTDSASLWQNNCVAIAGTNGVSVNSASDASVVRQVPGGRFAPKPSISSAELQRHSLSIQLNDAPQSDIVLPPPLQPANPVSGTGVAEFFLLNDSKTGVLALGSFEEAEQDPFLTTLLSGLQTLVSAGATQLIVDVVSENLMYPLNHSHLPISF